LHECTST